MLAGGCRLIALKCLCEELPGETALNYSLFGPLPGHAAFSIHIFGQCSLSLSSGSLHVVTILFFICRFQAPDLEVKLSDELAGSLRQLKVLNKLNFLVLLDRFPARKRNPLSVITFVLPII